MLVAQLMQAAFQNNSPVLWGINYIFEAYFLAEVTIPYQLYTPFYSYAYQLHRAIAVSPPIMHCATW